MGEGKPKRKRRTKAELDPILLDKLVAIISLGITKKDACASVGIHRDTLHQWERWGEAGKEPFAEWLPKLRAAQVETKVYMLGLMQKAASGDWRAGAWLLEKLYPKEYGRLLQIEAEVENVGFDLSGLSDRDLRDLKRLRALMGRGSEGESDDDDEGDD